MEAKAMVKEIEKYRLVTIIRTKDVSDALSKANLLCNSGVKFVEVTFTVPNAHEIIRTLRKEFPDVYVGAGTVINVDMLEKAIDAGACFIVGPNFDERISEICQAKDILYVPGIMTPTEIVKAMSHGHELLKVFPGEVLGPEFVKAMKGPFPDAKFIVTGGVSLENLDEWFKVGATAVGMGSSLTTGTTEEVKARIETLLKKIGV
ncbi:MAG: bifunctional 4-hydroxy-2-oxoglutarate aldolase/2-dehydro-3-deoxy-phosphogluconate aldolase [Fervidobacterium sp.]|uniref:bifunctional 4-hydroxy-2-oxoglutarate aldolase/2-dehydro-3-deoxy-phosphogluconate aldolase n=1 Tax=Fervidobacterium sp. TaxID=1871331 RepID=UPI0030997E4E